MFVNSVNLMDFRNFASMHADFSKGVNIFTGNNANGKTNILESIYLCATTKSQKGSKDREMIAFGKEEAHIRMFITKGDIVHKVDMHLKNGNSKTVFIDGIQVNKTTGFFGLMYAVSFSPEDLLMIKNGPSLRRRFLDLELCQLDAVYLNSFVNFNRCLDQRNSLLRQIHLKQSNSKSLKDTISVWDEQLVKYAEVIILTRKNFIKEIEVYAADIHKKITNDKENMKLTYIPDVEPDKYMEKLKEEIEKDIILKTTGSGPQRDDFDFEINGEKARKFASQGQQRTCALSLKLAEVSFVTKKTGECPILLLDDVLSELDIYRQNKLLENINGMQTFITCTGMDEFIRNRIKTEKIFKVVNGTCSEVIENTK